MHLSLAAKRRYSVRHCFLTYKALKDKVNQTPRNLKESLCGIRVISKLLSITLTVYGVGDKGRGSSLLRGSRLQIRIALEKLIFVLLKL